MEHLKQKIELSVEDRALYQNVHTSYIIAKRIFDIVAAIFGILILSPILLVTAIAIKLNSKGPVLFCQDRVGHKGKLFKMYKFRSMVTDAEKLFKEIQDKNQVGGYMFKMKDDPRVTKVGAFIRKTSIDELPQLFNVLIGNMSIVGPRPPILIEVVKYDEWHNLRMSVKPGITGLWQVSGRNKLGFEEMVRLDLKYIRERSFLYDLKIVLKTIPVLLGDDNAF